MSTPAIEPVDIILRAPLGDYLPSYISYVTKEGQNSSDLYGRNYSGFGWKPELVGPSIQIGRACELIQAGQDDVADVRLTKTGNHLLKLASDRKVELIAGRTAMQLAAMATVIRARANPEQLTSAYAELHAGAVESAIQFRQRRRNLATANLRTSREELFGLAGRYAGYFVEQVSVATLSSCSGIFAMPALMHHDRNRSSQKSHDLVLIAERADRSPMGHVDGQAIKLLDQYVLRKADMKRGCLALCGVKNREKGSDYRLRKYRKDQNCDIVLASGHCDFGEPGIGIEAIATDLDRRQQGRITPEDILELNIVARAFAGKLLNPDRLRIGRNSSTSVNGSHNGH